MNKFQFLGRLTKDVEVKYTNNNKLAASFTIAVNRRFVAQGGERQSDFFNLTAFGKTAEFCAKYFKKGQQVLVIGRMQNRSWDDQNGQKRYATDYIVEECYFADNNKTSNAEQNGTNNFVTIEETEELPF